MGKDRARFFPSGRLAHEDRDGVDRLARDDHPALQEGDPAVVLPQLAAATGAEVVAWNRDVEPYGRERDRQVAAASCKRGISPLKVPN